MNKKEFNKYWKKNYPESYPINHELKRIYADRWFRVHSLPNSKRYPETDAEYQILFDRQNQLIDDLIGEGTEFITSFGLYTDDNTDDNYKELTEFEEFSKVQIIDIHKGMPSENEGGMYLEIYIKTDFWQQGKKNEILRAIAEDKIRAMFICPSTNCIVAPYDGGVDIIVDTEDERDKLKIKYKDWLSKRKDGM